MVSITISIEEIVGRKYKAAPTFWCGTYPVAHNYLHRLASKTLIEEWITRNITCIITQVFLNSAKYTVPHALGLMQACKSFVEEWYI